MHVYVVTHINHEGSVDTKVFTDKNEAVDRIACLSQDLGGSPWRTLSVKIAGKESSHWSYITPKGTQELHLSKEYVF